MTATKLPSIAKLLFKYATSDLVRGPAGSAEHEQLDPPPEEFVSDLEGMGPSFVKFGQLLSTRADLLPPPYLEALQKLQDDVDPVPYDDVREVVESELGVGISKAFEHFDEQPLATGSLAQVHRARLRGGSTVAVKVQRPDIRQRVLDDLEALEKAAALVDPLPAISAYHPKEVVEEFRHTILAELDFTKEAHNLRRMQSMLESFERIDVPQPVKDYTTDRVLTMTFIPGRSVVSVGPLGQLEIPGADLADELIHAYLHQVFVEGFVHADPHPGNVLITDDYQRLALIDLGMTVHVDPNLRRKLLTLVLAAVSGSSDRVAGLIEEIATPTDRFDRDGFRRAIRALIDAYTHAPPSQKRAGELLLDAVRRSVDHGLRPPTQLTVLGRTLLSLDWVGVRLDPDMDVDRVVERHAMDLMQEHTMTALSPGNLFQAVLDTGQLAQELPNRLDRITESLAEGTFRVEVDAVDEEGWQEALRGAANRLTLGLVVAAMIVGSALLVRVDTEFTLLGYPGLATIFFLVGAISGIALMISIVRERTR